MIGKETSPQYPQHIPLISTRTTTKERFVESALRSNAYPHPPPRHVQFMNINVNFKSYISYYLIGFAILAGVIFSLFLICRLLRYITDSDHRDTLSPISPQEEEEEQTLLIEFNEKLSMAKNNSIATLLPIEVMYLLLRLIYL